MGEIDTLREEVGNLTSQSLLQRLDTLNQRDRHLQVKLLVHLSEVGRRKLYAEQGFGSLFAYCTGRLGWFEATAGRRIAVARAMERFPDIARWLQSGELSVSAVAMVAGRLTKGDGLALLQRIRGKSRREIEAILAELEPARTSRDRVRPLGRQPSPGPAQIPGSGQAARTSSPARAPGANGAALVGPEIPAGVASQAPERTLCGEPTLTGESASALGKSGSPSPMPLSEPRFEVRFCAAGSFVEKLKRVEVLLSGRFPAGMTYEDLFSAVLDEFLKRHDPVLRAGRRANRRSKAGEEAVERPRAHEWDEGHRGGDVAPRSRHIPAAIRDAVHVRDGGRCTYVSPEGVRCASQWDLELDHVVPFARGGKHSEDGLRLLCRVHNALEARRKLGGGVMDRFERGQEPGRGNVTQVV